MDKKFQITLHDTHEYGVETADATMVLFGTLEVTPGTVRIVYREEEGDLAGCTTEVLCKDGSFVSVCRTGPYSTELIMEEGKRHNCQYETQYGTMLMGVYAENVDCNMADTGGYLEFTYNIDFDGDFVSRNTLHITVKETF